MIQLRACESLVQHVNTALRNYSFYPRGHHNIAQAIQKSYEILREFFTTESEITIALHEEIVWIQDIPLPQDFMGDFIRKTLAAIGKDALILKAGITYEEWESFVAFCAELKPPARASEISFENIEFRDLEKDHREVEKVYNDALEVIKHMQSEVRMGRIPKAGMVFEVVDRIVEQILKNKESMIAMTLIKSYDEYLFAHSLNVAILCLALGETMGLGPDLLRELGAAAMVHDIGKTNIDPKIVLKPDKLNPSEWEEMKTHPVKGMEIIDHMEGLTRIAHRVALEHHMKYNHSGYPAAKPEYHLHPASLMLAICDAYDAMTTQRIYQKSRDPREVLDRMAELAGIDFEPNYLKAFSKMLGIYPQGMLVKLSTGDTAVVSRPNPATPDAPVVKIVYDAYGTKYDAVRELDLSLSPLNEETGAPIVIVGSVNPSWFDIDITQYVDID